MMEHRVGLHDGFLPRLAGHRDDDLHPRLSGHRVCDSLMACSQGLWVIRYDGAPGRIA
jgi:hypothetical protein